VEQPGEHLEGGRFPRTIRPQKTDDFTRLYGKANAIDGLDFTLTTLDQALGRGHNPGVALGHQVRFTQIFQIDDWLWHGLSSPRRLF